MAGVRGRQPRELAAHVTARQPGAQGGFGGLLSFELRGGRAAAERLLGQLVLPIDAPSLGGVETLITRPAATSHAGLAAAERERLGITESLIRLSVGVEDTDDLIADLEQALSSVG